jgi:hypothetical protein
MFTSRVVAWRSALVRSPQVFPSMGITFSLDVVRAGLRAFVERLPAGPAGGNVKPSDALSIKDSQTRRP